MTWDFCSVNQEATVGSDGATGGKGPSVYIDGSASLLTGTPVTEAWARFNISSSPGGTPASLPIIAFYNSSSDKDAVQILWTGDNEFTVTYNSTGTTYTTLGTFYSAFLNSYEGYGVAWDFFFRRGASGIIRVFANNTKVFEYTGVLNTVDTTFDGIRFSGNDTVRPFNYGGVILSDEPMFNSKLVCIRPSGSGNENGWSLNTFSNVDDTDFSTNFEDGNYVNTAGVANTHAMEDIPTFSDRKYYAVVVYVHAAISSGATPTGMNFRIRQGTTNYTKGALAITPGDAPRGYREVYTTDMLGADWTDTAINGLHVGVITT